MSKKSSAMNKIFKNRYVIVNFSEYRKNKNWPNLIVAQQASIHDILQNFKKGALSFLYSFGETCFFEKVGGNGSIDNFQDGSHDFRVLGKQKPKLKREPMRMERVMGFSNEWRKEKIVKPGSPISLGKLTRLCL